MRELLSVTKKEGKVYVSMLLGLYDLGIPSTFYIISQAILSITNELTRKLFLDEIHEIVFETPEDEVGMTIASAISELSNDPNDTKILIPPTLSQGSLNTNQHLSHMLPRSGFAFNSMWNPEL